MSSKHPNNPTEEKKSDDIQDKIQRDYSPRHGSDIAHKRIDRNVNCKFYQEKKK
jgi:hypothetical protein